MDDRVGAVVVTDGQAKGSWADVAVSPDEKSTKDWLGEEVEDSVEDTLRVDGDDVSTLADTPCDWVQGPEESGERSTDHEGLTSIGADTVGVLACLPDENVKDVDERSATKGEVSPLVAGRDKGTNKTGNNHDLVDENHEESGWPWHASGEEEIHKKERSGDDPIDVSDVVDLTVDSANLGVVAQELDVDWGPSQVRAHGEVCNGSDHGHRCGDVVEDTVLARLGLSKTSERKSGNSHHSADCPVPI